MMVKKAFKDKLRAKILAYKPDFDPEILNIGLDKFELSEFKTGDYIVNAGEICKKIFLIENSILRSYFLGEDGEEKTMWISPKMTFITEYESFSSEKMSRCNVHLYEDSLVYTIDRDRLMKLYADYHEWALVGILIVDEHFITLLKMTTTIRFNDASENYKLIENYFSQYLDVIPLKHLASWLNISAVHLSRIRNEKSKIIEN